MRRPALFSRFRQRRLLWLGAGLLWAATLARAEGDYLVRSWNFETEISASGLNCLCLGHQGFLWLGTKDGLVRFDGVQFAPQIFPGSNSLQGNNITAVWEDTQDSLWMGCESGEVYCWDRSRGTVTAAPQKWPAQAVRSIAGDGRGDIWIALASNDLVRIRDGWTLQAPPTAPATGTVQRLLPTYDGRLYQQLGAFIRLENGPRDQPVWDKLELPGTVIQRIAPSRAGGLWIFADDRIRRWTGTAWTDDRGPLPSETFITRMIEASSGDLFVGTINKGMIVFKADGTRQVLRDNPGSANERIVDLIEDPEGNILVCSDRSLRRLRLSRIKVVASENNWGGSRPVAVTAGPNGTWWVGTEGSGLFQVTAARLLSLGNTAGLSKPYIWSLLGDARGDLWVGTWGAGMFYGANGQFAPLANWSLDKGWAISALFRDRTGALWAGSNSGLWRQVGDVWTQVTDPEGRPVMLVRFISEDATGRIWLATNGHGLAYWEHGVVQTIRTSDEMPARFISSLYSDHDGNLWVGTLGFGLYRWDGHHWSHIDRQHGLPTDDIFHIADDGHGKLWFTSNAGVFAVATSDLEACAGGTQPQLRPLIIDRDDGLPSNFCSSGTQSAAFMGPDGQYIVPTASGVAVIPTGEIKPQTFSVPVIITSASIDDRDYPIPADHRISAPAGARRVAIEFTAPSFTNPERVHFRYQLSGLDAKWVDLGARRSVLFSHLPPGAYTLRVMASNPDGAWSPSTARLGFYLAPHYWETKWFLLSCLGLLLALVALAVWYFVHRRAQRRLEHLEHQQAIEQERRRIARDIHDELGASLTQVMMLSQSTPPPTPGPDSVTGVMRRIHTAACEITRSMDELVWAVNPSHDTLESLASYSARIAQELTSSVGLHCRLNLPDRFPGIRLSAGVRHHLLLVLKEALTNAIRHARATEITLTLAIEADHLVMEVADNGVGFEPPAADLPPESCRSAGGHGLRNQQRRAEEIGGTLSIARGAQRGTVLRLTVPLGPVPVA